LKTERTALSLKTQFLKEEEMKANNIFLSLVGIILMLAEAPVTAQSVPMSTRFGAPAVNGTANVGSPLLGDIVYDTSASGFYGYNGSSWTSFGGPWSVSGITISETGSTVIVTNAPGPGYTTVNNMGNAMYNLFSNGGSVNDYIGVETSSGTGIIGTGDPYAFLLATTSSYPIDLATNNIVRLKIDGSGNITASGAFTAASTLSTDLGVAISTTTTQPTCNSGLRGTVWVVQGGSGVADVPQICIKDASNNYVWFTL
jgi:hypothetical protein